ncbi:MAG: DUF1538 domain-containing protein [Clostridia bacterium]|nr:DUF1538 domain-containing protein [Clostridia bacterium]
MKLKALLKETLLGILPILLIITLLQFTIVPVSAELYVRFLYCTVFVVVGLTLFLFGIDIGFIKIGGHLGHALVKSGHLRLILLFAVILGFSVTLLEPDIQVFSAQAAELIEGVDGMQLASVIALGVGIYVSVAFLRIFLKIKIKYILLFGYSLAFLLIPFCKPDLSYIAFDAGGATTGALTVPFLLSLAAGVSSMISKKPSTSSAFGMIGIASIGPILSVLIMGVIAK